MKIHVLQHDDCEGLGAIKDWIDERAYECAYTHVYREQNFPKPESIDWLIIMGGPMGTYEEDKFVWLKVEKQFIRSVIDAKKTVLGICLGSQLLADVLGGRVYPAGKKEIGWFPVELTPAAKQSAFFVGHPQKFVPLHWHGDTFDLPPGAIHLAQSEATRNQAFQYGDRILALQYHLEATEEEIRDFIDASDGRLPTGNFVQTPHDIISADKLFESSRLLLFAQLNLLEAQTKKA